MNFAYTWITYYICNKTHNTKLKLNFRRACQFCYSTTTTQSVESILHVRQMEQSEIPVLAFRFGFAFVVSCSLSVVMVSRASHNLYTPSKFTHTLECIISSFIHLCPIYIGGSSYTCMYLCFREKKLLPFCHITWFKNGGKYNHWMMIWNLNQTQKKRTL